MRPLNRLFGPAEIDLHVATVRRRITNDRYLCADSAGRLLTVTTDKIYPLGALVIVSAGRIAGTAGNITTIEV